MNADGSRDTAFGNQGLASINVGQEGDAHAVAVQSDGKIIVAGTSSDGVTSSEIAVVRFTAAGAIDTGFGSGGKAIVSFGSGSIARAIRVQSDGKVVLAGDSNGGDVLLARLSTTGALDGTFGTAGKVQTDVSGGGSTDYVYDLALQTNDQAVVAVNSDGNITALRFTTAGILDGTFDTDGIASVAGSGSWPDPRSVVIQADGMIVVGGRTNTNDFRIVRFTGGGAVDFTQDYDLLGPSTEQGVDGVALQSTGKIIAVGTSHDGARYRVGMVRMNAADGSLDAAFGAAGKVAYQSNAGRGSDAFEKVALQADGKIVAAGTCGKTVYRLCVIRLSADGTTYDNSFDGDGVAVLDAGAVAMDEHAAALLIQPDGKILIATQGNSGAPDFVDFHVVRLNTNGALDAGFGSGGWVAVDFDNGNDYPSHLSLQSDGKIVVTGQVRIAGVEKGGMVRLNSAGP